MSPLALRRQIGQLLIAGFDGQQIPVELKSLAREFGLGGVILFARNIVEPEQVAELALRGRAARAGAAGLGERRPGRRPRRAPEGAVHRVAADGDARAERRRRARRAVRAGAGRRAEGRRHHARLRAGARHPHQPEEPGHRRSRAGRERPRRWRGSGRAIVRGAAGGGRRRVRQALSRVTATPAPIRTWSCRSSSIRPTGCARSSSCRSGRPSRPGSRPS